MNVSWLSAGNGLSDAGMIIICAGAVCVLLALIVSTVAICNHRHRKNAMYKDNRRISVRNVVAIDDCRRLVLIRCDNTEHLLLTGGNCDLVVESFPEGGAFAHDAKDSALFSFRDREAQIAKKIEQPKVEPVNPPENAYIAKPQRLSQPHADGSKDRRRMTTEIDRPEVSLEPQMPQIRKGLTASPHYSPTLRQPQTAAAKTESKVQKPDTAPAHKKAIHASLELQSESDVISFEQVNNDRHEAEILKNQTVQSSRNAYIAAREESNIQKSNEQKKHNEETIKRPQQGHNGQGNHRYFEKTRQQEEQDFSSAAHPNRLQNGQNGVYPHDVRNPEHHQIAGSAPQMQTPLSSPRESLSVSAERPLMQKSQSSSAAENGTEIGVQTRSSAGGIYAPYLGYIPKDALRSKQHEVQRDNGFTNSIRNGHIDDKNGNTVPAFTQETPRPQHSPSPAAFSLPIQRKNVIDQRLKQRNHDYLPQNGRNGEGQAPNTPKSEATIPAMARPSFGSQRVVKNGSNSGIKSQNTGVKSQNGRNNFHKIVTPPDDNDFDKILQDELLRAPNAIKFSASQKK